METGLMSLFENNGTIGEEGAKIRRSLEEALWVFVVNVECN